MIGISLNETVSCVIMSKLEFLIFLGAHGGPVWEW